MRPLLVSKWKASDQSGAWMTKMFYSLYFCFQDILSFNSNCCTIRPFVLTILGLRP